MVITLRMLYGQTAPIMDNFRTKKQWEKYEEQYGNPDSLLVVEEIAISGKTYKEKQESCRQQIQKIEALLSQSSQSYCTLVEMQKWVISRATTYGLLKEVRESGII